MLSLNLTELKLIHSGGVARLSNKPHLRITQYRSRSSSSVPGNPDRPRMDIPNRSGHRLNYHANLGQTHQPTNAPRFSAVVIPSLIHMTRRVDFPVMRLVLRHHSPLSTAGGCICHAVSPFQNPTIQCPLRSRERVQPLPLVPPRFSCLWPRLAQGFPCDRGNQAALFHGPLRRLQSVASVIRGYCFCPCEPGAKKALAGVPAGQRALRSCG